MDRFGYYTYYVMYIIYIYEIIFQSEIHLQYCNQLQPVRVQYKT